MKMPQNTKVLVFDSSTLISFSMNGLVDMLEKLKNAFGGKFIITNHVKREVIDRPMEIRKFNLEALKIKSLVDKRVLEFPQSIGLNEKDVARETERMLNVANSSYYGGGRDIHIIDYGEASCLAVARMLNERRIVNAIAIDERTTRMLGEKPENLAKLLEKRLHVKIQPKRENFKIFSGMRFIRSAELVFIAYKKGLVNLKDGDVLDALLYAMKSKGCAISHEEIKEIEKMR